MQAVYDNLSLMKGLERGKLGHSVPALIKHVEKLCDDTFKLLTCG